MNPHRGVCCVCTRVYREGIEPVSHGYCERHAAEAMAELDRLFPKEPPREAA